MSTSQIPCNCTGRKKLCIKTKSPGETRKTGERLGRVLTEGSVICLIGELGDGKTTFTQGIAKGLAVGEYVNSPTFKLINEYAGRFPVYHFDLYRLNSASEIEDLGYKEYFYNKGITIIEWADKIPDIWPNERVEVYFKKQNNLREINIIFCGGIFKRCWEELKQI